MNSIAFESRVVSWLMQDGWQVFTPVLDHGHKTDILISDGPNYFRIQVKTVEANGEDHKIDNKWQDSEVDYVVVIARNSTWGYVMPAFGCDGRPMNFEGHQRFDQNKNSFVTAFHKLP